MNDWLEPLRDCIATGTPAVLVTVAAAKGSVPREPGTKMIVTADWLIGTIGGGHLEWKATEIARRLLGGDDVEALQRFPLGASLGQCCGGMAQLLFEPITAAAAWLDTLKQDEQQQPDIARVVVTRAHGAANAGKLIVTVDTSTGSLGEATLDTAAIEAAHTLLREGGTTRLLEIRNGDATITCMLDPLRPCDWQIVLFGAGHVGQAVVRSMAEMPCRITWIDSRDAVFPERVPANTTIVATDVPEAEVDAASAGAYFLVMTHSHPLDQALTERILQRDFAYFGLIGSASKRRQFERRLLERGIGPKQLAAMTCPIGVPGINDKRPAVIAIAVAAELLQHYEAHQQQGAGAESAPPTWTREHRSASR